MAGMAVDGLVSGFNTTQMISQLMQLEAAPQTLLKGKVTKAEGFVSALQSLNTKLSSLADSAKTTATATSWQAVTASSSTTSVTATATAGAQTSALSFSVDQLATAQTSISTAVTDLADFFEGAKPPTLTLVTGAGSTAKVKEISLSGVTDLAGMAGAINKADAGVTATVVKLADGKSVVQLSGKATGSAAAFDLYSGTVTTADLSATPPPTPMLGRSAVTAGAGNGPGGAVVTAAADAVITLWGTEKATSASNTFSDVVAGVSFTVSEKTDATKPVTVSVARDDAALKKLGSGLVANISTVLSEVASRTKTSTTKGGDGRDLVTGGILSGDATTRSVQQQVVSAASLPVRMPSTTNPGQMVDVSPATVGLVLGRDGSMTFDETKFSAALAADPARVQAIITAVADRVQKVAKDLSDPAEGTLTLKIQSQQSFVKNLNEQVSGWDNRLALRRTALERTYSSLEVSLSNINAQASWLTSQLAQLDTNAKN